MKKFILFVSALVLTAACSAPSTNREAAPSNANVANPPAMAAVTEADAIANEKAIWETIKNKDYLAFGKMVAEDQLEVTGEAVFDKAGSITAVKDFEPAEVAFSDWKFMSVGKDAYVVTYTVQVKGKYKGKDIEAEAQTGRASSAWVQRGGKWLAAYHQECLVKPAMPPPPPAKASSAKAAASPAASPLMAVAGADPVANEKIVWDLFRAKDSDGFAALLSPDFLEVEPDKVYDKAAATKSVGEFDFSKAVLSDWKSMKLSDDAGLVTYTIKMPGMPGDGERHSSIWAKQGGTWLAVLHHGGTMVVKPGPMAAPAVAPSPAAKAAATPAAKASPAMKPMKKM